MEVWSMKMLRAGLVAVVLATAGSAQAQSIIKTPGDHPDYKFELEPHVALAWGHLYRGLAPGLGVRGSIVIVDNGFIPSINNSVAISFGLDFYRYSGCYYFDNRDRFDRGCGATFFVAPVALQWNFWLTTHWSVFGEPGLYLYHGIYDDFCDDRFPGCRQPTRTSIDFAFFVGGRYHFTDKLALTMRLGYPGSSVGLSILF